MSKFYSPSTNGFYDSVVNEGFIPLDANPISEATLDNLMDEQANGKTIQDDGTGQPEAVIPVLTNQEKIDAANATILQTLKTTAWTQAGDETNVNQLTWAAYRQDVRDVILQAGFPDTIVWPIAP